MRFHFFYLCFRTDIGDGATSQYAPPFHENVSDNPTFEQMQETVCVKKIRPDIPENWNGVEILQTLSKTMQASYKPWNFFISLCIKL